MYTNCNILAHLRPTTTVSSTGGTGTSSGASEEARDVISVELFIVEPEIAIVAEPASKTTGALLLNTNITLSVLHVGQQLGGGGGMG